MSYLLKPLLIAFFVWGAQFFCATPAVKKVLMNTQLFPFLAENGLYGYADNEMNLIIAPQYKTASVFTKTGYAVVQNKELKYGVINKENSVVMPFKYSRIFLEETKDFTLASSDLHYTRNSRFWDWRALPGLSVIGGGSTDKRLFNTSVQRVEKRLSVLENRQTIAVYRSGSSLAYHEDFKIKILAANTLLVDHVLYEIKEDGVHTIAGNIFGVLHGDLLLQASGSYHQVIDQQGRKKTSMRYRHADTLRFMINGQVSTINVAGNAMGAPKKADLFIDENNNQFIYPDFAKKFPGNLNNNVPRITSAALVMKHAWSLDAIPQSDRFLIRFYHNDSFHYSMVDTLGNWHNDDKKFKHFTATYANGDILWPPVSSIIPDSMIPGNTRVTSYYRVKNDQSLYIITIREQSVEKMGVWDDEKGSWIFYPKYSYIRALSGDLVYWALKEQKNSLYQLYHLPDKKALTGPLYHDMDTDGMVSIYENGKYLRFYLDWANQREFRVR